MSARYINAGFAWRRDERPEYVGGHQADGVAIGYRSSELIEVELTPKRPLRYASIFTAYRDRLDFGEAGRIACFCDAQSARAVRTALTESRAVRTALTESRAGCDIADRVAVRDVFEVRGGVLGTLETSPR